MRLKRSFLRKVSSNLTLVFAATAAMAVGLVTAQPELEAAPGKTTAAKEAATLAHRAANAARTPDPNNPRIGSTRWRTWIWATPNRGSDRVALGSIRVGSSVKLKSAKPVEGSTKWYAVEPFGYVFIDHTTTFDFETDYWKAISSMAPHDEALPYHYAYSLGAPRYLRVPTKKEWEKAERGLPALDKFKSVGKWGKNYEVLLNKKVGAIKATGPMPAFLKGHKPVKGAWWFSGALTYKNIPAATAISWSHAFESEGRTFVVTPELHVVPADRLFPYEPSTFEGVKLGGNKTLPVGWIRKDGAKKYRRTDAGRFEEVSNDHSLKRLGHVFLEDEMIRLGHHNYWRIKGSDLWLKDDGPVSVITQIKKLRFGIKSDERWINARIMKGTLVTYEGLKPIFTTMWSGGKGGLAIPGNDPRVYHTTESGVFPLEWKDQVATMSSDKGEPTINWFQDVPHVQYVKGALAMHVSFWHDRFGNLMSKECLNVSPKDGKTLFNFTRPTVPAGWNSIRPHALTGKSTKYHIQPY